MKPLLIRRWRGYLLRIVNNGLKGFEYEWTVGQRNLRDPVFTKYWRVTNRMRRGPRNLNKRIVDPTSSGCKEFAITDAKLEINEMIGVYHKNVRLKPIFRDPK